MAKSLEGVLIKKAHVRQKWSEEELEQMLLCADPDTGPDHFIKNFFYIQHPTKGKMRFQPFPFQEKLLESYHNYRFNVNMMPRQTGKTTTAAGYLLWYAMFIPDSTILISAHKYSGAQEIMQRVRYAYELCPDFLRAGVTSYNKGSIEFDNGSRIVSQTTTGTTGRGMSITLLYCDEFAFVPPNIASEFWTSISPTLSTGGKAIITSTPNSDEDQFALIWKEANKRFDEFGNEQPVGVNGFHPYKAHWSEHPERDQKWADEERARIGEERFRREHECEFIIFDETLISALVLADMEGIDPILRMGQTRWYGKIKKDKNYLVALDPSMGTGGDYSAIQVFEMPGMTQVAEWQHNMTPVQQQVRIMRDICKYITEETNSGMSAPKVYYSVENNTLGEAALVAINEIGEENFQGLFISEPIRKGHVRKFRKGFNTTHNAKIAACSKLKQLIETNAIKINSKALISQLKSFIARGTSFEAKQGDHDDLVMSMLLCVRMLGILSDWDPSVYNMLRQYDEEILPMPIFMS